MLLKSTRFRQVGANVMWLAGDRLFRMGLGFVVLGMVARFLGTSQFGVLHYAIGLTSIFAPVANLGIEGIVIRELVKSPAQAHVILGTAWVMRLCAGGVAIALVYLAAQLAGQSAAVAPMIVVVALAFLPQSFDVIDLWFQKQIQSKYTVLAKSLGALAGAALKITLVLWKAPILWFCGAVAFDAVFNAVALVWVFRGRSQLITSWRPSLLVARLILRDSWPLMVSGFLTAVYLRVEQVLVMNMLGSHSMGIYYASARLAESWNILPGLLLSSIYPILVEKRQHDLQNYRQKLQGVFDLLTGMGFAIAVVVTLFAPGIISLLYGAKYAGAVPILAVQAWTAPILFSGSVRGQFLLLENLTVYHTFAALLGIAANVTFALLLIPRYGAVGASVAALGAGWIAAHLSSFLFAELRECARLQTKAFFLPLRLPGLFRSFREAR
ncbi:MAG: flippase [Verrucomicrobia bacterium]|nr:flippase [Verrucomicrobiota bacterium]